MYWKLLVERNKMSMTNQPMEVVGLKLLDFMDILQAYRDPDLNVRYEIFYDNDDMKLILIGNEGCWLVTGSDGGRVKLQRSETMTFVVADFQRVDSLRAAVRTGLPEAMYAFIVAGDKPPQPGETFEGRPPLLIYEPGWRWHIPRDGEVLKMSWAAYQS